MDVIKTKKIAILCVFIATVHDCTKSDPHISDIGGFVNEGGGAVAEKLCPVLIGKTGEQGSNDPLSEPQFTCFGLL